MDGRESGLSAPIMMVRGRSFFKWSMQVSLRHRVGVVLVTCSGGSHLGFIYRKKVQTDGV